MVWVTGDCHGNFPRFSNKRTKGVIGLDDYVIVCGDFGLCWEDGKEFAWQKLFHIWRSIQSRYCNARIWLRYSFVCGKISDIIGLEIKWR